MSVFLGLFIFLTTGAHADVLSLKSVYFRPKQTVLSIEAKEILKQNADLIQKHPGLDFIIEANTERSGVIEENESLAKQRALKTKEFLNSLGIQYDKDVSVHTDIYPGVADQEPEARVEFKIIKIPTEQELTRKEEVEEEKEPSRFSLEVSGQAFYTRIDSTDFGTAGSSALVSNLNYRASLSVGYLLSENWIVVGFGSLRYESYVVPSNKTISNDSFFGKGFGAALKTMPTDRTTFLIMFNLEQNPFVRATSATNLVFDMPYIFKASLGMDYDVASGKTGIVGVGMRVTSLFKSVQSTYTIDQGSGIRGTVYTRNLFGLPLNANFSYYWQIENTTIATQIEQSLIFQLGWML